MSKPIRIAAELEPPSTLIEAVDRLLVTLDRETLQELRSASRANLIEYHFGLGSIIRNAFFHSQHGNFPLVWACGTLHVDDASVVILEALWDRLHDPE